MTSAPQNPGDTTSSNEPYYDPYDFAIDDNPYPVWQRLRDERPLYYNEKHGFYALSRYDDVAECLRDWEVYSSARGTVLEIIKAELDIQPGTIIFEDPPGHDLHRSLVATIFSTRAMSALEPKIRDFCAQALDPLVGTGGFDFIANLGAQMPMRTIGMLLGIPEEDQESIRDQIDATLKLTEGTPNLAENVGQGYVAAFADYIDYRQKNPSDDLMTKLMQAEFEDLNGKTRTLTRDEVLGFVNLIAAAGNETTARLIGWTGKVLAEHPDQRKDLVENPKLIPRAIEELLRFEPPSPVQARYVTKDVEHHGQVVKKGSALLLLNASANRDDRRFEDPNSFNIHRKAVQHVTFGYGLHTCLGSALARLEGRIALEEVLKRFPEWEVDWDNAVRAHTSTVRGWERLPVKTPS